jgi:hypothetical protein
MKFDSNQKTHIMNIWLQNLMIRIANKNTKHDETANYK